MKPLRALFAIASCLVIVPLACANSGGSFGGPDGGGGGSGGSSGDTGSGGCTGDNVECSGACVDPQTDNANCGKCGHACAGTMMCSGGTA